MHVPVVITQLDTFHYSKRSEVEEPEPDIVISHLLEIITAC